MRCRLYLDKADYENALSAQVDFERTCPQRWANGSEHPQDVPARTLKRILEESPIGCGTVEARDVRVVVGEQQLRVSVGVEVICIQCLVMQLQRAGVARSDSRPRRGGVP